MGLHRDGSRDFAYYADDWIWPNKRSALMKSTLLFFDGLALSLPQRIADRMIESSPDLAQPLAERGLLINLEPDTHLQPGTAARLAGDLHLVLEHLTPPSMRLGPEFRIGPFHWGGVRAHLEADALSEMMLARGLAQPEPTNWPGGIPAAHGLKLFCVDPAARLLILNAYCQALRADLLQESDIALHSVTETVQHTSDEWFDSMLRLMQAAARVTPGATLGDPDGGFAAAKVLTGDLDTLGVDVTSVPLDEILDFRAEHKQELRAYMAGVRMFLEKVPGLSYQQYQSEKRARMEHLTEEAAALKSHTRKAFGRTAVTTSLGLAGAVWAGRQGDLVGALLAGASVAAGVTRPAWPVTSYTYILSATHL
ncbi:hypothetical protein ACWHLZ_34585 [Streptomyces chartreusis]